MAGTITILLLDGHQGVREALAQRLRHAPGIGRVATAPTLDSALRAARDHAPQVVLYDPATVAGDAAEAVQCLKQAVGWVIVLTSSLLEDEAAALRRAGVAALVLKGTKVSALLALMETILAE
jgi:DNA-binding NarL/FixJ family response regulator